MLRTRPHIHRGGDTPAWLRGLDQGRVRDIPFVETRVFGLPRHGNTHVGPEAHTCLHVLIPFSFWRFSLSLALPRNAFSPPSFPLRFYLACLRYSLGRTNLVVHLRLCQPPLDISRDLNSFYFPYISRFTTPFCHPPASYVSSNGFSPSFAPSSPPALPSLNRLFSDVILTLRSFLRGSFELYSLSDIVTNVRPTRSAFSSRTTLRRWETSVSVCEKILLIAEESLKSSIYARGWSKWST